MKVFCPIHKRRFTAEATTTIICEREGGHVLGGPPNDPATKNLWSYCCNCANFMPLITGGLADSSCQVCDRKITTRFLCDRCQTLSFESAESSKNKEFRLTKEGLPKPNCAGCLKSTEDKLREHECESLGVAYKTLRSTCPFDGEPLIAPPSFPCSAAKLLEDARDSISILKFDAESNLLRESLLGNYVLLNQMPNSRLSMVIPTAQRLNTKRDYYDKYYELFNCDNPAPGELIVLSPAVVEKIENGWQLREPGFIDVKPDVTVTPVVSVLPGARACAACGEPSGVNHAYCKRCGAPVLGQSELAKSSSAPEALREQQATQYSDTQPAQLTEDVSDASPDPSSDALVSTIHRKVLLAGGATILLGVIVGLIAALSGSGIRPGSEPSIEQKLDRAIAAGNLFTPSNENAHDLYHQLKNRGASETTLASYRQKLLPKLTDGPMQMFNNFMIPGSGEPDVSAWQAAAHALQWAAELKPNDQVFNSRVLYCEGRVAYQSKQEDQAMTAWKRAADADKSWALPSNGIGLIHFARKNYGTARAYYLEAIRRDPNWPYPYNNLGTAFYYEKNNYSAKEYYRKAIERAPRWARPHAWLAEIAMKERDFATAVAEYEAVLDQNATGTANMDLIKIRSKLEEARQEMIASAY